MRVLLIESDPRYALALTGMFGQIQTDIDIETATCLELGIAALRRNHYQLILCDTRLSDSRAPDASLALRSACPSVPIILLTAEGEEPEVARAMEEIAEDCLVKDHFDARLLERSVRYSMERKRLFLEISRLGRAAEEANRAKDEFVAMVSHELRTPLQGILGWAVLLRDGKMSPVNMERALASIEQNARDQDRIIDDLLDMSRIVGGKLTLETAPVVLVNVIQSAVESVRAAADAKQIDITSNLAPDVPVFVGDPNRLRQALGNLLANSVRFTPRGGRIDVKLRYTPPQAEIEVRDDGTAASMTREHGGLGIGLGVARRLVEMHGGNVRAFGEVEGATFSLCFPVTAAQKDTPGPSPSFLSVPRKSAC